MNKTKIDYLDYTWNPIEMKCTPVSAGCKNCWHLGLLDRFQKEIREPSLREAELDAPGKIKMADAKIGVQFMGDLFHDDIPFDWHSRVFGEVVSNPGKQFLHLTKRPKAMKKSFDRVQGSFYDPDFWLDNVWAGVSVECHYHEGRIMYLKDIPTKVRWVSFEPLIGPVRLIPAMFSFIDWVVIGCESGPGRRPCELEWINDIVQQCREAQVPVYVKQIPINGRVSHNISEWPDQIAVRQLP